MNTRTLAASLPSGAVYVSGIVNGVGTVWTNTSGNTWETIANRSVDDTYRVELIIINSLGTSSSVSFTLYYGIQLITDRTRADVDKVVSLSAKGWAGMTPQEREEYLTLLKGSYNSSDLNRVGSAMKCLESLFNECGYLVSVNPKTDWTQEDEPTREQMSQYLYCVSILRRALTVKADTPIVPDDMEGLTYQEANNIEKILQDIEFLLKNSLAAVFYSGDIYSGEV